MSDEAKVRFLFRKVQHDGLRSSIDALKALETAGTVITYTMAANHLSTAVSELPEYLAKKQEMYLAFGFRLVMRQAVVESIMKMDRLLLGTYLTGDHFLCKKNVSFLTKGRDWESSIRKRVELELGDVVGRTSPTLIN